MKVALLKYSAVDRSGGARQMFALARELQALGVAVEVALHFFDPDRSWPELTGGLEVRYVERAGGGVADLSRYAMKARRYAASAALARLVSRSADVLNPHEWSAVRAAALAAGDRPVVWMSNDPCPWDYVRCGRRPASLAARLGAEALARLDDVLAIGRVDRVLVLDERNRSILRCGKGLAAEVVRSGIDLEAFARPPSRAEARAALGLPKSFIALAVGIHFPHRRHEDLIHAFASLEGDARLLLVGSPRHAPAYFESLRRLAAELGVADRTRFVTEQVTDAELATFYRAADVFVFPNEEQTWGLVVTEAMACGTACVVSTGAGVHEIVEDAVNGVLVPPRDPARLAAALVRLRTDPDLRERVGAAGREYVRRHLSWRAYAERMLSHFEDARRDRRSAWLATRGALGSRPS